LNHSNVFRGPSRELVKTFTRTYPFKRGCARIAQIQFLKSLLANWKQTEIVSLRSGERIEVPLNDFIGRTIYYFGDFDPKISWLCRRILRPGDTAIDIGANMGVISIAMAGAVGSSGVVHAFEPQPNLAARLINSAALNHFDHLHVHQIALGAEDGTFELFIPGANSGSASLIRRHGDGDTVNVLVRQGTPFLDGLNLTSIRLIKIDVEGFENSVFTGAADFLTRTPADAIIFEANDHTVDSSVPDFIRQPVTQTLSALGYFFVEIGGTMMQTRFHVIDLNENAKAHYSHDILAVHNGSNAGEILSRLGIER
jgi:FkbM family methyltransferase